MRINTALILILFPLLFYTTVHSDKILGIFQHPAYSHFRSFYPILHGLAERGHDVTIVTYFPTKKPLPNYKEIILEGSYKLNEYFDLEEVQPDKPINKVTSTALFLIDIGTEACEKFYESDAVEKIIKSHSNEPFQLVIKEIFNTECILGLTHLLQIPVVALSSCNLMPWHYDRMGLPDLPSYITSQYAGYTDDMNYLERFQNFLATKATKLIYRVAEYRDNKMIKKYLNIDVNVRDLFKDIKLLLVNQHYSLSGPKPLPPQVVEVGGLHMWEKFEQLPKDLETFINESEHGIIFISWGSLVKFSSISKEKLSAMVNALKKLPQRVVWKWDGTGKPVESKHFFITKWILQREVLCHPKVKLFWSHGGLLGVSESAYCGVPMVVTPMYGDQYLNAKATEKRQMGKILMYDDITEDNVYNAISEVLQPSYSWNAKYVSKVYRNRQNTPLETAFWWIEHVLETKGNNLTYSSSVDLNWFVYYSIDAILTLFVFFIIVIIMLIACVKLICKLCCKASVQQRKSKTS